MKPIRCNIPNSLYEALERRSLADTVSRDSIIANALSQYLDEPVQTLFQVSTSAALVEGLYEGAVQVSRLLRHGDFGLGTFVDLEGEMVVLEGICYQILSNGTVRAIEGSTLIPYAVVTHFFAENSIDRKEIASFDDLVTACDAMRDSDNLFYAFRIMGRFASVTTRVMRPVQDGAGLKAAADAQRAFLFEETEGTLVGMWSPAYAGSFSVPGYHFHFLSKDFQQGGHVLACHTKGTRIESCRMSEMQVSLPVTDAFLQADLTGNPGSDLMSAEQDHSS